MTASLLDACLPTFDVVARYHRDIPASPSAIYAALRRTDFAGSFVVRALFALRGLVAGLRRPLTLERVLASGFVLLADDPPRELVLGVVGRFWSPSAERRAIAAGDFRSYHASGDAKAVWNFLITDLGGGVSRLSTETRVQCLDAVSRRSFRRYWFVVGPFSGLIRRIMLRAVAREVAA